MRHGLAVSIAICTAAAACPALADEFRLQEVGSLSADVSGLQPKTISFTDHRNDRIVDGSVGLGRFEEWEKQRPQQIQFLVVSPLHKEPADPAAGLKTGPEKLHLYVAEARFLLAKPAASLDLAKYVDVDFLKKVDPSIQHQLVSPMERETVASAAEGGVRPSEAWCGAEGNAICLHSRYKLEGKLPMGVLLVNKVRGSEKQIPDFIDFWSELSALPATDIDQTAARALTGIDAPVVGALEQKIFRVNQVLKFGKFIALFQPDPKNPQQTIVTAQMALAVPSKFLERKKEYADVPVLRNLLPAQVLMGNSSFNSGNSISAGLPAYARNQTKALAALLDQQ